LNPSTGKRFLSPPKCPDRLWWSSTLLFNGCRDSFFIYEINDELADYNKQTFAKVFYGMALLWVSKSRILNLTRRLLMSYIYIYIYIYIWSAYS